MGEVSTGSTEYEWDEAKRDSNLRKHGDDLADGYLVYEAELKVVFALFRETEERWQDLALVEAEGLVLLSVYTMRGSVVRLISLRRANRTEKNKYAARAENDWERVRREAAEDGPIPYDEEDRAEGLYDAAVETAW